MKQDHATAALLVKNHPYNIMHLIIPHAHPPDLIQAQLSLRPETEIHESGCVFFYHVRRQRKLLLNESFK